MPLHLLAPRDLLALLRIRGYRLWRRGNYLLTTP